MTSKHHIEQEIKLTAPNADALEHLINSPQVRKRALHPDASFAPQHFRATYYDTPDWILRELRWSLRTRYEGKRHVSTLKRNSRIEGGYSSCEEIEQLTPRAFESVACIPEGKIAEALHEILPPVTPLHPRVEVSMHRRKRELKIGDSLLELVTDAGVISANGKHHDLCEVELELLQGDMHDPAVEEFIRQLSTRYALNPSTASKHQIGLSHYSDSD